MLFTLDYADFKTSIILDAVKECSNFLKVKELGNLFVANMQQRKNLSLLEDSNQRSSDFSLQCFTPLSKKMGVRIKQNSVISYTFRLKKHSDLLPQLALNILFHVSIYTDMVTR